jgi:hypothetical protein
MTVGYIAIEDKSIVGSFAEVIWLDIGFVCAAAAAAAPPTDLGSVTTESQPLDISVHY